MRDAVFDLVLFTLSYHHQDRRKALEEAHRVLREGGRVFCDSRMTAQ